MLRIRQFQQRRLGGVLHGKHLHSDGGKLAHAVRATHHLLLK